MCKMEKSSILELKRRSQLQQMVVYLWLTLAIIHKIEQTIQFLFFKRSYFWNDLGFILPSYLPQWYRDS